MTVASTLDHLVIVCTTLEEGVDYCERVLGVRPKKGGQHVRMATHNYLLNLGDGVYLEVIAVDPDARSPDRPRWFGMDANDGTNAAQLPCLTTFVARTNDIAAAAASLPALGPVTDMQRGDLTWQITIRDDGALYECGTVPALIQWPDGVDPTVAMPDLNCRLAGVEVYHPQPDQLRLIWEHIGLVSNGSFSIMRCDETVEPYLVAHIKTPGGIKTISGKR